jgi:tetratricopeptide (TPR) repeat protein
MQDPRSEQLNLAGTHLNLTAILTKLGKHKEAITHAKASIIILRKLIDRKESIPLNQDLPSGDESRKLHGEESKNLYLTEAIAYYNLGASYEHLDGSHLEKAVQSYSIAS